MLLSGPHSVKVLKALMNSAGQYLLSFVGLDVKGYKHRCSFEQGMCSWEKSDLEAGWILQKGEQAWPKHGPPRDHTHNTAAGAQNNTHTIR